MKTSKAQQIREFFASNPEASPAHVSKAFDYDLRETARLKSKKGDEIRKIAHQKYRTKKRLQESETVKKALVISDLHAPYQNKEVLELILKAGKRFKPHELILNGDTADCYQLSYFRKDPIRMRWCEEVSETRKLLLSLTRRFPSARKLYIKGNHEERLEALICSNAPALRGVKEIELEHQLHLAECGYEYICNDDRLREGKGVFSLGPLAVLHGHENKMGLGAVNPSKLMMEKINMSALFGHIHRASFDYRKTINEQYTRVFSTGCVENMYPGYAVVNKWVHGFAMVTYTDDWFDVDNRVVIGGKIYRA